MSSALPSLRAQNGADSLYVLLLVCTSGSTAAGWLS